MAAPRLSSFKKETHRGNRAKGDAKKRSDSIGAIHSGRAGPRTLLRGAESPGDGPQEKR